MTPFHATHEFPAPPRDVAAAMTDPAFVTSLELPDFAAPEVLEHTSDAAGTSLRVRMRFTGSLDPIARRVLRGSEIAWVQDVRVDSEGHHGELNVRPEGLADRLRCRATYDFEAGGPGTVRTLDGTFEVRVPLISGRAEKHILPGLVRRLDLEAEALAAWLQR
jgi:hypothetical protein